MKHPTNQGIIMLSNRAILIKVLSLLESQTFFDWYNGEFDDYLTKEGGWADKEAMLDKLSKFLGIPVDN